MSIIIICKCGKKYKVKNDSAGKRLKCTECGDVIGIPDESSSSLSESVQSRPSLRKVKGVPCVPATCSVCGKPAWLAVQHSREVEQWAIASAEAWLDESLGLALYCDCGRIEHTANCSTHDVRQMTESFDVTLVGDL